jgi:hypothetical protein
MPLMFKEAFPVFIRIMTAGGLLAPTASGAKLARLGSAVRKGPFTPVPLTGMASGLILVLSVTVMVPDSSPVAVGAKFTVTAQRAFGARAAQSFVWVKVPLATMLAILRVTLLGLLIVIVLEGLVVPTPSNPKLSEGGEIALKAALNITETAVGTTYAFPPARSGDPS